jgi:hypothetical protein
VRYAKRDDDEAVGVCISVSTRFEIFLEIRTVLITTPRRSCSDYIIRSEGSLRFVHYIFEDDRMLFTIDTISLHRRE